MAEEESIEDSLRELLKCPVCLEISDSLKALRCQHTICFSCLQQLTTKNNRFKCPSCNQEELIPSGGLELLANCRLTQQVAHILSRKRTVKPTLTSETANCDSIPAEEPSGSVSTLLATGDDFGLVPPSMKEESSSATTEPNAASGGAKGGSKRKRKKKKKKTQARSASAKPEEEVDMVKLREDLTKAVKQAQGWCRHAEEKMSTFKRRMTALSDEFQKCTTAVKAYQRKKLETCKKRIAAVKERQKIEMVVHRKNNKVLERYLRQMEETNQKVASCSKKINGKKRISAAAIAEAQMWAIELKHLNSQGRRLPHGPGWDDFIRGGDSLAFKWLPTQTDEDDMREFMRSKIDHSSVGVFMSLQPERMYAAFPEQIDFNCTSTFLSSIPVKRTIPHIGDKVRRKITSSRQVSQQGILREIDAHPPLLVNDDYPVVVEFQDKSTWTGHYSEIELIPNWTFEPGDKVRVNRRIPEPSRGWGGVNGSSVGVVLNLQHTDGLKEFVVDFPECNAWIGLAADLELARDAMPADEVQVKLSVKTPSRGWRSVTHQSSGVMKSISDPSPSGERTAVVQFRTNKDWDCNLSEIEPARYRLAYYDRISPGKTEPVLSPEDEYFFNEMVKRLDL